jgi:excisionase family DNA binding protein
MTRDEFVVRWRTRSDELARLGAQVDGAKLCGEVLHDFELVCQGEDDAELTLEEAADLSGYSPDHLRRLVREKKLQAYRRGRRLFFRGGSLPKKPVQFDALSVGGYNPAADARRVATQA